MLFPSSPPPSGSVRVLCRQLRYIRLAVHRCLITQATSHISFIKLYQSVGSLLAILWRTRKLDLSELFTASDRWPAYNVRDNRQWSRKQDMQRTTSSVWHGWGGLVSPLTTSGCLSANHSKQLSDMKRTCVGSDPKKTGSVGHTQRINCIIAEIIRIYCP